MENEEHPMEPPGPLKAIGINVGIVVVVGVLVGLILFKNGEKGAKSTGLQIPVVIIESGTKPSFSDPNEFLSEANAKYLQDAEHLGGFVLGDLAFPKVENALKSADAGTLEKFFHPDFKGELFSEDDAKVTKYPFGIFKSWVGERNRVQKMNRVEFVQQLIDYRKEFSELTLSGLKVMKMSPVTHGNLEGPWEGTCKLILAGRTTDGRIAERVIKFRCRLNAISENTPDLNEWMTACEVTSAEYASSAGFLMRDMTSETGIDVSRLRDNWIHNPGGKEENPYLTGGIFVADYNRDGHVDILLTDVRDDLRLYEGKGKGRFEEAQDRVGLPVDAMVLAFADFNGDGFEDLLMDGQLFKNESGKQFRALGRDEFFLDLKTECASYSIVDFDRDGKLDLYVVGGVHPTGQRAMSWIGENEVSFNRLYRNLGNWKFEEVTTKAGVSGNGSPAFGAVWFDANGDNWPDVMTACYGMNDFFINQQDGTFRQGKMPEGYGGFSMGISVSDIDNDGFGDPFVGNMYSKAGERVVGNLKRGIYPPEIHALMRDFVTGDELYRNRGDGTFDRYGEKAGINDVGWAYGVGFGDLNGDGLPDAYSPVGFQSITPNKPDG
ncbi:MAG: FG-GAP repeat domain-containing protein [Verrucomicrobiales bacterium]